MKNSWLFKLVKYHYRDKSSPKSEKQIEDEKYLIFNIPFNRWILFASAFFLQFCLGFSSIWSIFNKPIDKHIFDDPTKGRAPIAYYLETCINSLTYLYVGPWLERNGPRKGILVGGILFSLGQFVMALGAHTKQISIIYIGYGLFCGIGHAFLYLAPVSALQKWFPDHKGLASGFAVCGVSAGVISFSQVTLPLLNKVGLINTFIVYGSFFFFVFMIQAFLFRLPPPGYQPEKKSTSTTAAAAAADDTNTPTGNEKEEVLKKSSETDISDLLKKEEKQLEFTKSIAESEVTVLADPDLSKMSIKKALHTKEFRLILFMFFANGFGGLIIGSRISNLVQDIFGKTAGDAATVITINGVFNLVGRVISGPVSERIGRLQTFIVIMAASTLIFSAFAVVIVERVFIAFVILVWVFNVFFGGFFGTIPAFLSDQFGNKNISPCHAIILTVWNLSGVFGGFLFTGIYDSLKNNGHSVSDPILYTTNLYWAVATLFVGLIKYPNSTFKKTFLSSLANIVELYYSILEETLFSLHLQDI
ncbi:hypothetical protein PPL_04402 [Heterostelium album PN500]|uniref:Major facilitator superfamily (MFS) profile domain-containing protein n=1 Tax=Heterostelium pallidum (strain ATCC 26659 / Pp 5 / PN500) TaxID=670386 RepID=D3B7G4_HETP5|nr:hypothetical protein PPL_04402 [Heterostelium album PN500]EFA82707.1 hypothetical protein PPL_04402 [Heterostelium album PN500]|eukprot:XP_020434824.1 hypothetical protein PPL_04402 [Heterostelium album PN500]